MDIKETFSGLSAGLTKSEIAHLLFAIEGDRVITEGALNAQGAKQLVHSIAKSTPLAPIVLAASAVECAQMMEDNGRTPEDLQERTGAVLRMAVRALMAVPATRRILCESVGAAIRENLPKTKQ